MKNLTIILILLANCFSAISQDKKTIEAIRIDTPPKIDGLLDDTVWQNISAAGNFNMYEPGNEGEIPEGFKTEVKMAYDDNAVYVAAYMFDPEPDKILSQFSQRDEVFVQADHFAIALNTYNDGINETHFFVTSAGTIGDAIAGQNNFDFGYNVVFDCKISKNEKGWFAEFKIPYNALRFPEIKVQDWAVNFYRGIKTRNETHTWNFIDKSVGNESQYSGNVSGVKNINPPIRLTLFPFAQGIVGSYDGDTETDFKAGLDLKYGLSDSFTLDATLIPDFGQAAFDEVSLNLGPFEQTFDENRAFFTEGVDLFNKGRIFFSRRVGGAPVGEVIYDEDSETILEEPDKVNLLNAVKVSGRTKGKLGVGFFNAVTEKTFAKIKNNETGEVRKQLIEPLSNYNIFVLDQQFNDNSSVSLINTNVTRNGHFRDGNVTAGVFSIADKQNRFRTSGRAIFSNVNLEEGTKTGFQSELDIFRIKGKFRYRIGHDFANTTLDINDLGLNFRNNFNNFVAGASYQIFEPTNTFNRYRIGVTARHRRLYKPSVQTSNTFNLDAFFVTTKRFAFGGNFDMRSKNQDYFEPRVDGKYVTISSNLGANTWLSTDFRKKIAVDLNLGYRTYFDDPQQNIYISVEPRYRFSDKFLVIWETEFNLRDDNFGYIDNDDFDVFFGQRDVKRVENSLTASYNFDPYKAIDLRFRNFWGTADYTDNLFYTLNDDGSLTETDYDTSEEDPNTNFNIWNIDLSFRWRFAPGSEATLLYRNQIFNEDELSTIDYGGSLENLFNEPAEHSLSLRITYFIDYNNAKHVFKKNS
ncbi:MAG: carbohydrate binding family 9 domain-containing protein [Flavobacteriaceae bacterium]|nr:carbohydrate binding family 9 domain-containing protein [Flavobacteriaceae bacterium]